MRRIDPRRLLALAVTVLAMAIAGAPAGAMEMHAPSAGAALTDHAMDEPHANSQRHEAAMDAGGEDDCSGDGCEGCACTACFAAADTLPSGSSGLRLKAALRHALVAAAYVARTPAVPRSPPKRLS